MIDDCTILETCCIMPTPRHCHTSLPMPTVVAGVAFQRRLSVCMSVCLFSARFLKNRCSQNHQTYIKMFHHKPWKPIYFGVKRSNVKVTRHKKCQCGFICTLVSAGFFYL